MLFRSLLTTIVKDDPLYAYFNVSERDLLQYVASLKELEETSAGEAARDEGLVYLGLSSEDGFPHEGRADFIENRVDPGTGTIQVRAVFPNPDHLLLPGVFVRIRLPMGPPRESLLVPDAALGLDQRGRYLLVANDRDEVEYRSVETGQVVDGLRVIEKGIGMDDRVIVNGLQRARPGIKVKPQAAAADPADPPDGSGKTQQGV